jgi:hypothetical protein
MRGLGTRPNAIDSTFSIFYNKLNKLNSIADGSGLIPSDIDARRGLVGCLIADSRCVDPYCNAILPKRLSSSSILITKDFMRSSRPTASIESSLFREHYGEKVRAMDGRGGTRGFRVARGWVDPSSRTNSAVQLDNQSSPVGPDGHP